MTEDPKDRRQDQSATPGVPGVSGTAPDTGPTEHFAPPSGVASHPSQASAYSPQTGLQPPYPGPSPYYGQPGPPTESPTARYDVPLQPAYQSQPGYQQTGPMPPYPYAPASGSYPTASGPGGPPPTGYPPAPAGAPTPDGYSAPRRRGRGGLAVAAVALVLIGGGVGGAVGAWIEHDDTRAPVDNALSVPPPKVDPGGSAAPAGTVAAVAQKVVPSVVMIRVAGARAEGEGSGVVLSSDGLILTNNHVASGAGPNAKMDVQFNDGSTAGAAVVGIDPVSDLAVIKTTGKSGLTPIELGTSTGLQVGQSVVAVGSPLGLAGTVTTGIVSALNRPVSTSGEPGGQATVISAVQTDAPINPGNSGGALVDMTGKLIGINTAIATLGSSGTTGQQQSGSIGLGFAIPVDQARRVADQLTKTGHATYAQIGISVRPADDVNGARVLDVTADGPAAKAGISANAIVTKVDGQVIDSGNSLIAAVRSHPPGTKVKITYTDDKGHNAKTVEVTLGEAAADGGH